MKHALFDEAGFPLGFYDEDIHGAREIEGEPNPATMIPADAVAITDAQWQEFLANQGRRRWQDGEVVEHEPEPEPEPEPQPIDLIAYAADKRWRVETGGITVNGAEIRTDEKSQSRVSGAALLAQSDPDLTTIDWEAQPGEWVTVAKADMIAIGIAVGRHVQACFTTLRAVQKAIADGTITTVDEIEAADWPASG